MWNYNTIDGRAVAVLWPRRVHLLAHNRVARGWGRIGESAKRRTITYECFRYLDTINRQNCEHLAQRGRVSRPSSIPKVTLAFNTYVPAETARATLFTTVSMFPTNLQYR